MASNAATAPMAGDSGRFSDMRQGELPVGQPDGTQGLVEAARDLPRRAL